MNFLNVLFTKTYGFPLWEIKNSLLLFFLVHNSKAYLHQDHYFLLWPQKER